MAEGAQGTREGGEVAGSDMAQEVPPDSVSMERPGVAEEGHPRLRDGGAVQVDEYLAQFGGHEPVLVGERLVELGEDAVALRRRGRLDPCRDRIRR